MNRETTELIRQLQFVRRAIDPEMSVLSLAMFLLIGTFPDRYGVLMSTIVDRLGLSRSTASRKDYSLCSGKV